MAEVLVIARVSKTVMPLRVPTGQVPSEQLVVFATDSYSVQAVLSSNLHQLWAITYGSGMRNGFATRRLMYSRPSSASDKRPPRTCRAFVDGKRREIMLRRDLGLTKLYNLVNDAEVASSSDEDVDRLRALHVESTEPPSAYGWDDITLDHGFHSFRRMQRWSVSPSSARRDPRSPSRRITTVVNDRAADERSRPGARVSEEGTLFA
ncbi:MAG: hypothetical protein R2698_00100 [Microthrixaceae bacterium]